MPIFCAEVNPSTVFVSGALQLRIPLLGEIPQESLLEGELHSRAIDELLERGEGLSGILR